MILGNGMVTGISTGDGYLIWQDHHHHNFVCACAHLFVFPFLLFYTGLCKI